MKSVTLLVLLILVAGAAHADTSRLQGLGNPDYHRFSSDTLGRDFHLFVSLPDGYAETDRRYPAVYLLDGGALFPLISAYYRYLRFSEEVPDLILVGISYGSATFTGGNYRSTDYTAASSERDYWGGGPDYQAFLSEELLPFIEDEYRADAARRVLFGQSLGGQFVLLSAMSRPGEFWGYIASNPALHRNLPAFMAPLEATTPTDSRLYVASAEFDDPAFREPALAWMEHWVDAEALPWTLNTVTLPGHTHMSAPPASFRSGMAWLFAD